MPTKSNPVEIGYDESSGILTSLKVKLSMSVDLPDPEYDDERPLERWGADLVLVTTDEAENAQETVVANARLARVHDVEFGTDWIDELDADSSEMSAIGAHLLYTAGEVAFADALDSRPNLLIVEFVEVDPGYRGQKLSHELVKALAEIFSDCMLALIPSETSDDGSDEIDVKKRDALVRHWGEIWFKNHADNVYVLQPTTN